MLLLMLDNETNMIVGFSREESQIPNFPIKVEEGDYPRDVNYFDYKYIDGVFEYVDPEAHLVRIVPDTCIGALRHNTALTVISAHDETPVTIEGECMIEDQAFQLPLLRNDGRWFFFDAIVRNGRFKVVANFPTIGEFVYGDQEANHGFDKPVFKIDTMTFRITRKKDSVILNEVQSA